MEEEVKPTEVSLIDNIRLRHIGVLDLDEFYRWLRRWFVFEGYNIHESHYLEEIDPKGKIYKIIWKCKKKKTDYFEYYIEIRWLLAGISKIELQRGTDKVRIEKGDFELRMDVVLRLGSKKDNFLAKHEWFRKAYENFLIRDRIDEMKWDLYKKADGLQDEIKTYFNQETHV